MMYLAFKRIFSKRNALLQQFLTHFKLHALYFFVFNTACYLVTQQYFWPNLFANNGVLLTSVAQPFRYMNAYCGPSGESLTNYVAFL